MSIVFLRIFSTKDLPSVYHAVKTLERVSLSVVIPFQCSFDNYAKIYVRFQGHICRMVFFFLRFVSCISLCDRTCLSLPLKKELL